MTVQARSAANNSIVSGVSPALSVSMTDPVPVLVSFTPGSGSGASGQFTMVAKDLGGMSVFQFLQVYFSDQTGAPDGNNRCHLEYVPGTGKLYLDQSSGSNDSWVNSGGTSLGSGTLAGTTSAPNTVCSVNLAQSSASISGNTLTLVLTVNFLQSGNRYLFLSATNATGSDPWIQFGTTWTVP